jgi:hypothetical protein
MVARIKALAGMTFKWDGTAVAGLEDIGEIPDEWESVEKMLHDTAGHYPEQIITTRKGGEIKCAGIMLPADPGQVKLVADYASATSRAWIRGAPDGSWTQSGIGYVKSFKHVGKSPKDIDAIEFSILIDGEPVFAYDESDGLTTTFFSVTGSAGASAITPAAAQATLEYNVTLAAGSTTYYITPIAVAGVIKVLDSLGAEQTVISTANSTAITATANGVQTVYISVKETGKVAKIYTLHVGEPV